MATEETNRDYEQIERPYDYLLQRSENITNSESTTEENKTSGSDTSQPSTLGGDTDVSSNGNVENMPVKDAGAMDNLWINKFIRSQNWKPKKVGFYIDGQTGYAEFSGVYISGNIEAISGTIGGFTIGATDLSATSGGNTTIVSSGLTAFTAGPTGVPTVTITQAGLATFSNISITGGAVATSTLNGTVSFANLDAASQGWVQTSTFSVTDANTVEWGAGTFTTAGGVEYSISANNTGNMSARTYIYLATGTSVTEYQTSITASDAVGAGKVLVAVAENGTVEPTFTVFGSDEQNINATSLVSKSILAANIGDNVITADQILANTITATEIAATTITAAQIAATTITAAQIAANTIDVGQLATSLLYAGAIIIDTAGLIRSGQTAYNTGTGWWIGNDSGTPKLSIGVGGSTPSMLWTGTDLLLNGSSVSKVVDGAISDITYGLFRGSAVDGLTEYTFNSTITRSLVNTSLYYSTGSAGSYLKSGTFGISNSSSDTYDWTSSYSWFGRVLSPAGTATGTFQGDIWFWGMADDTFVLPDVSLMQFSRGRQIEQSHIGFIVDEDDKLFATSGSGLATGVTQSSSQDITELSTITHTNFNNYEIVTNYAAFPAISNTGATRPTGATGGWTNIANTYDADTNTFGYATYGTYQWVATLSGDTGTTYTMAQVINNSGSKATTTIGGQYDTWGKTWSVTEFTDANFSVMLSLGVGTGSDDNWGNTIEFDTFSFNTSTWKEITGIKLDILSQVQNMGGNQMTVFDIHATVYYTTTDNTGYVKFYANDTLLATHTASVPRSTDTPILFYGSKHGNNTSTTPWIIFNNYKVKVLD